jgi:phage I-like protein
MFSVACVGHFRPMLRNDPISLHAAGADADIALCAALDLPAGDGAGGSGVPEWIQLTPAGTFSGNDGRGPYRVTDAAELARTSLQAAGGRLVLDENHATDLALPRGEPAPARGWIVDLQARPDGPNAGIWGKVEWTPIGRRLMREKAYRYISPAIRHRPDGTVTAILRASLINRPNLRGMAALHQENDMTLLEKLLKALGLDDKTTEDQAIEKVTALHAEQARSSTALQAALTDALGPIAEAAGLKKGADATAVLAGVAALKKADPAAGDDITKHPSVVALQGELATVAGELKTLRDATAKEKAEAFVDGAIKAGRVGVKPMRDEYVAMHMEDAARTEKLVNAMPALGPSGARIDPPAKDKDGKPGLTAEQRQACALMGVDPEAYRKTLAAEAAEQEAAL